MTDITKQMLELMLSHDADIYYYCPSCSGDGGEYGILMAEIFHYNQVVINNMVFNRELTYGIPEKYKYLTEGSKAVLKELMKPYYVKDNPYYGASISKEQKQFFQKLEQARAEEEKELLFTPRKSLC